MAEKESSQPITKDDMHDLLAEQSKIILGAVDERFTKNDARLDEKFEEVKRHMNVVAEDLKGQIRQVTEGVMMNTERLERIEKETEKIEPIQDDIEAIKVTVGDIKAFK